MRNKFMKTAASLCRACFRRNFSGRWSAKRAELSCRTYVTKDGILSPEEWSSIARRAGVQAITIMDRQDVRGFWAAEELRGETEPGRLDVKVLYGLETELEDGNRVHLLVRRQEGLAQLYRLLETAWQGREERPFLRKAEINEHRAGLLVGCPGEDGELYRGIFAHWDDARLEETARFYDYLSVPPLWRCNLLSAQGPASGGEALICKIVTIGKRAGKPVAAAGSMRTTDQNWGMFRTSIAYGIQKEEGEALDVPLPDLLYTEEMLRDFSFLGKELAEEIVLHGPNRLVDFCGEIRIFPPDKQRFQPLLPNAFQTVADLCREQLQTRYNGEIPETARKWLDHELAFLQNNELFCSILLISRCLVRGLREKGYPVNAWTRSSYSLFPYITFYAHSYAAYLLGVTEAEPLAALISCETFDRLDAPALELLLEVPGECLDECRKEAIRIFEEMFPQGMAVSYGDRAGWARKACPSHRWLLVPDAAELRNWVPLRKVGEGYTLPYGRPEEFPNVFRFSLWSAQT